jgi:adenylosuccinate synthase
LSSNFIPKLHKLVGLHNDILKGHGAECEWKDLEGQFLEAVAFLKEFKLIDSEYFLNEELRKGSSVLAEGAQGSLLDIDFGSYPFVTSSNTVSAGACTGLGIAPSRIGEVFGIFKAYSTRVGSGPFPTELSNEEGERMRKEGNEYGSTTGRPRRCGWIDLPSLKYSIMINGVTQLLMMKADVLSIFDTIKACTHYQLGDGSVTEAVPYEYVNEKIIPVYTELKGWKTPVAGILESQIPRELSDYIAFLERELKVPITLISTGPDRTQTIHRKKAA